MNIKPLEILFYQDPLCAWCYVADLRLEPLRQELGDVIRWKTRPYALRAQETAPSSNEIAGWLKELDRARAEPEGRRLSDDLWTSGDVPNSSVPALAAIEAAKLQGPGPEFALSRALRRAALEQGINVTRTDVVFEIASQVGLEMNRFSAAFGASQTRRLIVEEHRLAQSRGIRGAPTLVLGGRWMISGLREATEYRSLVLECLKKAAQRATRHPDRLLQ